MAFSTRLQSKRVIHNVAYTYTRAHTFLLNWVFHQHVLVEVSVSSTRSYWSECFINTFLLKWVFHQHVLVEVSVSSTRSYWSVCFINTFLLKWVFHQHVLFEVSVSSTRSSWSVFHQRVIVEVSVSSTCFFIFPIPTPAVTYCPTVHSLKNLPERRHSVEMQVLHVE
jgi:hypothetical protein